MATVLIVDDEPDILLFVRVNLELDGHEVVSASDGEAAIAAVDAHRPDVIVLDVMMPKLDGWQVLERLKVADDPEIRTIPVVMLTALGGDYDQVRGGIEGAIQYLPKPVTPDDLLRAVRSSLEGDPEPMQRKATQQRSLERLARLEKGGSGAAIPHDAARPRLGGLERLRDPELSLVPSADPMPALVGALTDKQQHVLRVLKETTSVSEAAMLLDMSRSNIYASLRRVGRKLDMTDVSDTLRRLRAGELDTVIDG